METLDIHGASRRPHAQLANVLAAQGVAKGDRVGLYLPSTPLMALAFWACQRLGAVPAPLSAMFRHDELRKVIERTGITALVTDATTYPYFSQIIGEFAGLKACLASGGPQEGALDLDALVKHASPEFEDAACSYGEIASLFFTSGTTGTPKGIAQTHFSTCSTLRDMMVSHRSRFGREIYLNAVPLFTNFGLTSR